MGSPIQYFSQSLMHCISGPCVNQVSSYLLETVAACTFIWPYKKNLSAVLHSKKMTSNSRFQLHRLVVACYRSLSSHLRCSSRPCPEIQPCTAQVRLLSSSPSLCMVHPQNTGIYLQSSDLTGFFMWLHVSAVICWLGFTRLYWCVRESCVL